MKLKKILAFMLVFAMCLSLFPASAFAQDLEEHTHIYDEDGLCTVCGAEKPAEPQVVEEEPAQPQNENEEHAQSQNENQDPAQPQLESAVIESVAAATVAEQAAPAAATGNGGVKAPRPVDVAQVMYATGDYAGQMEVFTSLATALQEAGNDHVEDGENYGRLDTEVTLLSNAILNGTLALTQPITLDLNGKKLTLNSFAVTGGSLILKGTGELVGYDASNPQVSFADGYFYDNGQVKQGITIRFDACGGTPAPAAQFLPIGSRVTEPAEPSKTGYTFAGWFDGEGYLWDFSDKVYDTITLTAHWTLIPYSISYVLDGGTTAGENPGNYTIEDTFTLINPIRENYVFKGWTGTDLNEPTKEVVIENATGDRSYTANWVEAAAKIGGVYYETLSEAVAAAQDGETVTVLKDCSGNGIQVPQGKFANGLTVDFNSHTYTMDGAMVGSTGTQTQAFQLLKDNKITFKNGAIYSAVAKMLVQNYSDLTLDGMTLTLNKAGYNGAYTLSNNNGNVVIKNSTINANNENSFAFDVCRYSSYPSVSVTVEGNSVINGNIELSASGSDAKDGFSLKLKSGTFNGEIVVDPSAAAAMAATPDKAGAWSEENTVVIPEDFKWVENAAGGYDLKAKAYVAQVGEAKFETLQAAIDAAHEMTGDVTVTLLTDITEVAVIHQKAGLNLTVDGAGKTITGQIHVDGNGRTSGTETLAIRNMNFAYDAATYEGGFINLPNTKTAGKVYTTGGWNYAHNITVSNCSFSGVYGTTTAFNFGSIGGGIKNITLNNLTADGMHSLTQMNSVDNVTISGCTLTNSRNGISLTSATGTVAISNNNINACETEDGYTFRMKGASTATATLSGNTFRGYEGLVLNAGSGKILVSDGFYAGPLDIKAGELKISGGYFTEIPALAYCADGLYPIGSDNADYPYTVGQAVATVNGLGYETLEAAFAAAQDGDTIVVLADCAGNGIIAPQDKFPTGLTVDFGGHTYDFSGKGVGSTGTEYNGFQLLKGNTITFQNGTITATSEDAGFLIQNYSNLTLKNMTIDGTGVWGGYVMSNNNGNVVIDGTTITAKDGDVAFDVCRYSSYPSVYVDVTGNSVINGNIELSASGSDAKDGFGLKLTSATVNGEIVVDPSAAAAMAATPEKAGAWSAANTVAIPEDFKWVENTAGGYDLKARIYVAQIGEKKYETLAEAVAAANTDDVIEIIKAGTYTLPNLPRKVTVKGSVDDVVFSHTTAGNIAGTPSGAAFENVTFELGNVNYHGFQHNGGLTFTECTFNGKFFTYGNETYKNCTFVQENSDYNMWVYGGDTVVYDGCTFTNNKTGKFLNVYNESGATVDLTITGCTFINGADTPNKAAINIKEAKATDRTFPLHFNVRISGCTLQGQFPADSESDSLVVGANGLWQVDDRLTNGAEPGIRVYLENELVYPRFVASVSDGTTTTEYTRLQNAVAAVPADGTETTITMIDNETIVGNAGVTIPATKNVVLDLNGYTIKNAVNENKASQVFLNDGTLTIKDSSEPSTGMITNAVLEGTAPGEWWSTPQYNYATNVITNRGTLNVQGGTIYETASGSICYAIDNNSTSRDTVLNISGGTVKKDSGSAVRMFCNSDTKQNVLNLSGGSIEGGSSGLWIQLPGSDASKAVKAELNVTGGTLSGSYAFYDYSYGNSFNATKYTLSGGTFNGDIFSYGANIEISGGTYNGEVAVKQTKPSEVSVTGGKFAGDVYTYGDSASEGFITGGLFATTTYEDEGTTYDCDWLQLLHPDYKRVDNTDPETKDAYPYTVAPKVYVAEIGTNKYESLEEAFAAAEDGNTITVLADCSGNGIIAPQGKFATGLTVDFDGHTYDFSGKGVGSTGTEYNGFQLLRDNTITFQNGTITATSDDAGFLIQNYSNLTLDHMTIDGTGVWGGYVMSNNCGNVVIKDTTILAADGDFAFDVCRYSSYPSVSVTVKGDSVINGDIELSASGSDAKDGFRLNLNDGTFNGKIVVDPSAAAAMENTPDKASAWSVDNGVEIPDGYCWQPKEGQFRLAKAVAQIDEKKYATLEEAFAAAEDGDTITVLADCSGNGIIAPQGKFPTGLTVDFDGHTYDFSGKGVGSTGTEYNGFQLLKDNTITFQNGTITATSEDAGFLIQNYSNLTLKNMTIDGTGVWGGYVMSNNNGNVVIDETTITAKDGDVAFDVCRYSSYPSVYVDVKGNSVINGNIELSASGSDAKDGFGLKLTSATVNGEIVVDPSAAAAMAATPDKAGAWSAANTVAIPEDFKWVENTAGGYDLKARIYVAQIGEKKYESLEDAVAAAVDGDTITVLKDCSGNGIIAPQGKFATGLTVDFDGHTYDFSGKGVGSTGTEYNGFQLLKDNTITFQNGTITATSEDAGFLIQNYSNLTLKNMTIDGTGVWGGYVMSNNNGNVVIDGTTITAKDGDFAFDVCRYSSYPSVSVTVEGDSVINGDIELSASGSNAKEGFSLNLNGGTFNGKIVVDASAAAAMENTPEKASANKANAVEIGIPEEYVWDDNGDNTSTMRKAVTVSFNSDGGSEVEAQKIAVGKTATEPAVAKEGYDFKGWFAPEATEAFDFATAITENITLTAKWSLNDYTVTLTSSGNGTVNGSTVAHLSGGGTYAFGSKVTLKAPAVSGYYFVGWYRTSGEKLSGDAAYEYTVGTQNNLVAVYAPTEGGTFRLTVTGSKFTINDGTTQRQRFDDKLAANGSVTLNFVGNSDEKFLYWVNGSGKIMSKSPSYTFLLVTDTVIEAVTSDADTGTEALVAFVTSELNGQVISQRYYGPNDPIVFPSAPTSLGKVFTGWNYSEEQIHEMMANQTKIVVYPVYQSGEDTYTVTIQYVVDGAVAEEVQKDAVAIGTTQMLFVPAEYNGKTFSYWADENDTVLGFKYDCFRVRPTKDMTIKAVYGVEAEPKPIVHMTNAYASGSNVIYFTATRSIPDGYTLEKAGIVYAGVDRVGTDADELQTILALNSGSSFVTSREFTNKDPEDAASLYFSTSKPERQFIARAYIVVQNNSTGEVMVIHSNNAVYGSFNELQTGYSQITFSN